MKLFSIIVIPLFILFVVFYGYIKKVDVYSSFLEGAKEGMKIVYNIFPAVLAMVFAVNIFLDSNIMRTRRKLLIVDETRDKII